MAFVEKYVTVTGGGLHDGSSEANAWTLAEALSNYAAGDRLNVKAGTYNVSSTVSFSTAGTQASPIAWRGYKTTIGDLDSHPTTQRTSGTDCPLFNFTGTALGFTTNSYQSFEQLHFISSAAATVFDLGYFTSGIQLIGCRVESTSTSTGNLRAIFGNRVTYVLLQDCYFSKNSTADYCVWAFGLSNLWKLNRCTISGGGTGYSGVGAGYVTSAMNCIFKNQGTLAMGVSGHSEVLNCSFYNSGGDFLQRTGGSSDLYVSNCAFSVCGGYAINNSSGTDIYQQWISDNLYHDSSFTSGRLNNIPHDYYAKVATSSPYVDAAAGDFTIASSSAGYNNAYLFEKDGPTSYLDSGAIRHQDPSGGGGAVLHPLASALHPLGE